MKILFIVFMISFTCYNFIDTSPIEVATHIPTTVRNALENGNSSKIRQALKNTRRIIGGKESFTTRPYMVFLKLPSKSPKYQSYRTWLCGGVIIHEEYILTSAACIEDTKYFYVVSGTYTHSEEDNRKSNICLKNSAKRAIWKCIPRNYAFDGQENDNLKWMNNDIAIVKVEDEFDFERRIRGCDFIPKPIAYNNQSDQLEEPGTIASVAGWGTIGAYGDWVNSRRQNSKHPLMDAPVILIPKKRCKNRWGARYNNIIDNYMICTRDYVADMTEICSEKYAECTDIMGSGEDAETRRDQNGPDIVHSAYHNDSYYRRAVYTSGGFCENDHGGPLVYSEGVTAVVIGVISACLVKEKSNKCYGPFLYTSVYKNRFLINCSLYKSTSNCEKLFRSTGTHVQESISWKDHPDGPGKNEIPATRRTSREYSNEAVVSEKKTEQGHSEKIHDSLMQSGAILIKNNVTINVTSTTEILQTTSEASAATTHIE